ncbi:hypothetical protein J7T55_013572 [Diaporthe amygdali]|uniref:uncharacterized protein n=1 Tax=Phomopsis amygdali TaxID=1214568 RepID=UPI0022FE81DB|nr:uncharacterized protein J7T55_013572 [Diaporthe amygdali]KAJ0119334.1 hypothetical protein J7T55_013572 [Diaporthe amygdali]
MANDEDHLISPDNGAGHDTHPTKSSVPARKPTMADYFRVFSYATKWDFCMYAMACFASIAGGATLPFMNIIFGQLVKQFTGYFGDSSGITPDTFGSVLDRQALYIMALFLARWALNSITKFCFQMIGIRLSSEIRLNYLEALFAQPIQVIDSMPPGAPATAITATSNTLQIGISDRLGTFLQYMSTIVTAFVVSFIWSWDLTLVMMSLILYTFVVISVVLPPIVKGQTETAAADTEANAIASEALGGIRLIIASGAQAHILSGYQKWVDEAKRRAMKVAPYMGVQFGLLFFGVFGAFGLAFWYGTQRFIAGAVSDAGVVIVVLFNVTLVLNSLERISTPLIAVTKAMVAACEFFTVIDMPKFTSGSTKLDDMSHDIILDTVTFAYPSRPDATILDNLSLRIRSGQNTALVGPSGSGKSTIVGLLERWYSLQDQHVIPEVVKDTQSSQDKAVEPEQEDIRGHKLKQLSEVKAKASGSISFGGHDLGDLDLKWWRSRIGLVQQEPFLFNDTIYGNVTHGLIGTEWEDEPEEVKRRLVETACHEAYAHEFISRLPQGYDTPVGDGGAKLSGGQKQRLAIARSIIKKPSIIILDEATSAIDARSERIVQAALDRATQNRTTITIAHRLSTIRKADNIIVMQKGRVVEEGTHQELLASELGVYTALVRAQSLGLSQSRTSDDETLVSDDKTQDPGFEAEEIMVKRKQDPEDPEKLLHEEGTENLAKGKKSRGLIRSFGTLLYNQQGQWPYYVGIVLSSMAVAAGTPIQAWLFSKVISVFLLTGDELKTASSFWGLAWLYLALGVGLAYLAVGWIGLTVQYNISAVYKEQYFTDMLYQKLSFFDQDANSHGTLSARVASDAKQLEELLGLNLAFLFSGVFTALGSVTIAIVFAWKLGLIAAFVTMPIMLASGYWKFKQEVSYEQLNSAVFQESSQFATEAIGAIRTVSSLTMEGSIGNRYRQLLDNRVKSALRKARWTSTLYGFADSIGIGCQALVFWYGGRRLVTGEYSLEAFFVCFMAIIQGAEAAGQSLAVAPNASQATVAANRILDVHASADTDRPGASENLAEAPVLGDICNGMEIEFQDVSFKYPTRDIPIFDHLSLKIERGQYAAFVGPSGCGKSTILSLLERFYELGPQQGSVLCNGANINDSNVYKYRKNISLVAQEPIMFRGTIRDNILLGIENPSSISEERIAEVCRDAFIHDFIISLPEGYDTYVSAKGVSLSGGQKQRIAVARALIRNPKVLLLDEATSALDSESEKMVQAALERARDGRTMVAVAHRLSTIQNADVIFVFEEGRVVEKGTHEQLVQKRGIYWGMCQAQALDM